jgi:decaprenylphospho-beta-D-erythro-pentofuranosid-2-ulose 2-reductase
MSATAARSVLLLGGTSEIGLAILRALNAEGPVRPVLLGRDPERLRQALTLLGLDGETGVLDAEATETHGELIARAFESAGGFDVVILAVGLLAGQDGVDAPASEAGEVMRVNFEGSGSLLLQVVRGLRDQIRSGTVVVLSTVAVERPRASNAIYGAAKAGLDALAQGLADASAAAAGPRVLVVRPGFVKTRMTAGLRPAPFATTADAVAAATVKALHGRAHTVWVPGVLRYVFAVLRHLPRGVFRRLPL